MSVRDHLDGLWSDEDFVCWYPRDGRLGLSPAQLATVCVLQFLLNLSDRQAAEALRSRIDVKYALGMELDDPGFHHSVLSDFRDVSLSTIGPIICWIWRWSGCGPPGCRSVGDASGPTPRTCSPRSAI
jgi:transposase